MTPSPSSFPVSPSPLTLWGWPILLGLLTASGLVWALVSDHWGDRWSWFSLGMPVVLMAWHGLRRQAPRAL